MDELLLSLLEHAQYSLDISHELFQKAADIAFRINYPVGLFDRIEVSTAKNQFRLLFNIIQHLIESGGE